MRSRWVRTAVAVGVVMAAVVASSWSVGPDRPSRPAGATVAGLRAVKVFDKSLSGNYMKTGTKEAHSSPAIGDITGDDLPEIVIGTLDGWVIAYRASDFKQIWGRFVGNTAIQSSPVLADVGGDGRNDVVVGTMNGKVWWIDGPTGRPVRTFSEGAPRYCPAGVDCRKHGFFATPAVADLTGDGKPEIIAASWDSNLYAWDRSGHLKVRRWLEDTLWSSPVVTDIDGNGSPEIVLGGDIYAGNPFRVPAGGLIWALRRDGSTYPGYPISVPGQTVWSTPALTDLNGDGHIDIVVGTGSNFPDSSASRKVFAYRARDRARLPGWPVTPPGRVVQGPAVGDVDGDGRKEVAVGSEGGYVSLYTSTGGLRWRRCVGVENTCRDRYPTHGSAVIADVDRDGEQEVVAAMDKDVFVLDGTSGAVESSYRLTNGNTLAPPSLPAIGESQNGKALIAVNTVWDADRNGADAGDTNRLYVVTTDLPLCRADWPMFMQNFRRPGTLSSRTPSWLPFPCARLFVEQQYRDFVGRDGEAAGVYSWIAKMEDHRWTGPQVIQSFMDSAEFGKVRAPLVRARVAMTGKAPDASRLAADARALRAGKPLAELVQALVDDGNTTDASGTPVARKTTAAFVRDAYRYIYGRQPTSSEQAQGEYSIAQGTTRGAWLVGRSEASAAQARMVPEVYVSMSYIGMLGRSPDAKGYAYWVAKVRSGASVRTLLAGFQASAEYKARVR